MILTPSQPEPGADFGTVRLCGHCTTVTAEDLRTQLVGAADFADGTRIEASEVLSVGQAVLQLLIAACREARALKRDFEFVGASQAFLDRVVSCQLADAIGLKTGKKEFPL